MVEITEATVNNEADCMPASARTRWCTGRGTGPGMRLRRDRPDEESSPRVTAMLYSGPTVVAEVLGRHRDCLFDQDPYASARTQYRGRWWGGERGDRGHRIDDTRAEIHGPGEDSAYRITKA